MVQFYLNRIGMCKEDPFSSSGKVVGVKDLDCKFPDCLVDGYELSGPIMIRTC